MAEAVPVSCPSCGSSFRVAGDQIGQTFQCPRCQRQFVATAPAAAELPATAYAAAATASPPPPPPPPPMGYATPASAGDPYAAPGTSGMAVASLVCGILFFLCAPLFGALALTFGIIGIVQTKPETGRRGRGMAIAGVVLGAIGLLVSPVLLISILLPSLNKARETANRAKCASNMHQIGLAILLYQMQNRQQYPTDLATMWQWERSTPGETPLDGSVFVCPSGSDKAPTTPADLALPGRLSYKYLRPPTGNPDATTAVLVEDDADHDKDGMNVLFGDGHADWERLAAAHRLIDDAKANGSVEN